VNALNAFITVTICGPKVLRFFRFAQLIGSVSRQKRDLMSLDDGNTYF